MCEKIQYRKAEVAVPRVHRGSLLCNPGNQICRMWQSKDPPLEHEPETENFILSRGFFRKGTPVISASTFFATRFMPSRRNAIAGNKTERSENVSSIGNKIELGRYQFSAS